nr:aa3-type cytochrome c oxidase subunit IV [Paracoccus marinus]
MSHDKAHDTRHAPHVHGDMDITAQQRGFAGFVRFATWNVVAIAVILIFLALANA